MASVQPRDDDAAVPRRTNGSAAARQSRPGATQPLMTITEVAEHLGVGERHVRRLVAERRIPYLKWGHLLRFDPGDLDRWLESARVQDRHQ